MEKLQLTKDPIIKVGMLIRKPVAEVFEAFINPDITTKFWFTKSSGKLEVGRQITWAWEMYNATALVNVKEIEINKRILVEWGDLGAMTKLEWTFTPYENDSTFVNIVNSGFQGDGDSIVAQALDSLGGFTIVLDGAKVWLEHNINPNLIVDKFPKGLTEH
ncbi:MAG: SRPBCC family protein [Nitrospinae bacterium]|nr:SRPBCC family protein [Nitrospinota bacterium]